MITVNNIICQLQSQEALETLSFKLTIHRQGTLNKDPWPITRYKFGYSHVRAYRLCCKKHGLELSTIRMREAVRRIKVFQ